MNIRALTGLPCSGSSDCMRVCVRVCVCVCVCAALRAAAAAFRTATEYTSYGLDGGGEAGVVVVLSVVVVVVVVVVICLELSDALHLLWRCIGAAVVAFVLPGPFSAHHPHRSHSSHHVDFF